MHQVAREHYQLAKKISLISILVNFILGLLKIVIGWFGHSQALLADGVHSLSDLVTDILVIVAAKAGSQAPDKDHPYGHGRIETVGVVVLSLLLMAVGLGIIWQSLHVIFAQHSHFIPSMIVVLMAGVSTVVNEVIFRITYRAGKRIQSKLLIANAWHHRSDAWSSFIVLVGSFGTVVLHIYFLDALAALIVSVFILRMSILMAKDSIKELIDTGADEATIDKMLQIIASTPGVKEVHQLRTRSIAGHLFVDVHIQVDSLISVSEGHYISDQVYRRVHQEFEHVKDVTVHVDPEDDQIKSPSDGLPNRDELMLIFKARCQNCQHFEKILGIHLDYLNGKIYIRVTLPLSVLETFHQAEELSQQYHRVVRDLPFLAECTINFQS